MLCELLELHMRKWVESWGPASPFVFFWLMVKCILFSLRRNALKTLLLDVNLENTIYFEITIFCYFTFKLTLIFPLRPSSPAVP